VRIATACGGCVVCSALTIAPERTMPLELPDVIDRMTGLKTFFLGTSPFEWNRAQRGSATALVCLPDTNSLWTSLPKEIHLWQKMSLVTP
jgi:hypothetical protein